MITYAEKGSGLHRVIAASGHWLEQRNGEWISSNDAAVQTIIDGYMLADTQAEICTAIDAHAATVRERATAGVSAAEMSSWSLKIAEARAYTASGNASDAAPLLTVEAQIRNVPLQAVVDRVMAKSTALQMLEATIAGVAGLHKDAVRSTTNFADALAYDWSTGWPAL
ncbi:MAG: hypothetical protein HY272_01945 [Gammaproteobacteria bacterium]|nr:hypothetical protein [Gammaproteobacteria bacterium]